MIINITAAAKREPAGPKRLFPLIEQVDDGAHTAELLFARTNRAVGPPGRSALVIRAG